MFKLVNSVVSLSYSISRSFVSFTQDVCVWTRFISPLEFSKRRSKSNLIFVVVKMVKFWKYNPHRIFFVFFFFLDSNLCLYICVQVWKCTVCVCATTFYGSIRFTPLEFVQKDFWWHTKCLDCIAWYYAPIFSNI